ncbi:MAG TPA: hypothetical protein VFM25_01395 [Verrucomicrobiae bacterium]|nr:hypothetical protein [Verrucomicrobiae bacterium]
MRCLFIGLFISTVAGFSGCTSTYTSGSEESPNRKYVVFVHVRGAGGRPYIDQTRKAVFISIEAESARRSMIVTNYQNGSIISESVVAVSGKTSKPLLQKKYHIRGADVCWDASWQNDKKLNIFVYDYGPGQSSYDARKNGVSKHELRTLYYSFNSNSGRFVEQSNK